MAMDQARPARTDPHLRRAAARLHRPHGGLQQPGHSRARGRRRRRRSIPDLRNLCRSARRIAQPEDRAAFHRPHLRVAGHAIGECDSSGLHTVLFRTRPEGGAPAPGGRLLQSAAPDRVGHRLTGAERCYHRGRRQRFADKPIRANRTADRDARSPEYRAGQPGTELCAVPAARAAADGAARRHCDQRRLCGGL